MSYVAGNRATVAAEPLSSCIREQANEHLSRVCTENNVSGKRDGNSRYFLSMQTSWESPDVVPEPLEMSPLLSCLTFFFFPSPPLRLSPFSFLPPMYQLSYFPTVLRTYPSSALHNSCASAAASVRGLVPPSRTMLSCPQRGKWGRKKTFNVCSVTVTFSSPANLFFAPAAQAFTQML